MTFIIPISCRCVSCTQCGATTPGLRCDWQNNYTQCAPCASLATCPICLVDYSEGTIIVQCRQCDRCAVFLQNQKSQPKRTQLCRFLSNNWIFSKLSLLSTDGFTPRVRVSIQKKMWKRLQTTALTAQCAELSRPLKVRAQGFLFS